MKEYGEVTQYTIGQRVEISPACDLWMRGARFGAVTDVQWGTPLIIKVRMDHPQVRKLQAFTLDLLRPA